MGREFLEVFGVVENILTAAWAENSLRVKSMGREFLEVFGVVENLLTAAWAENSLRV